MIGFVSAVIWSPLLKALLGQSYWGESSTQVSHHTLCPPRQPSTPAADPSAGLLSVLLAFNTGVCALGANRPRWVQHDAVNKVLWEHSCPQQHTALKTASAIAVKCTRDQAVWRSWKTSSPSFTGQAHCPLLLTMAPNEDPPLRVKKCDHGLCLSSFRSFLNVLQY